MPAPLAKYRTSLALAAALLAAACAAPPPGTSRGALGVIENVLAHEGPPPPSPALVRALLADPRAATNADRIFTRSAPPGLARLAVRRLRDEPPVPLEALMNGYLEDLAHAQRALKSATNAIDALPDGLPSPDAQRAIAASVDERRMREAAERFFAAHARLLERRIAFPAKGTRYARGDIEVRVGTPGDDVHRVAPVRGGAVSVILEPGGDDRYEGSDLAAGSLRAILDLSGDDRYVSDGAGWGAALAGVSLLLDASGNDRYRSGRLAQGAALAGVGVLLDLSGGDTYELEAFGQGLGLAGGTGVLWDRDGDDRYRARGLADPFERGGALSYAQGAAVGVRIGRGGGAGLLRDDAGDDIYEAQLYAQGAAYYYGLGLLWDRRGRDRYRAARYAQGAGVHQAVGVLRDDEGGDTYVLDVGVGQGAGVDLAVGALHDAAGDDTYRAPTLAQGAATANGVGIFDDRDGRNAYHLDAPPGRGSADGARGLPSVALVLGDAPRLPPRPVASRADAATECPTVALVAPADVDFTDALRRFGPELILDRVDPANYARLTAGIRVHTRTALASLPAQDFDALWPLGTALACALRGASANEAARMWRALEQLLVDDPSSRFAGVIAQALRERAPPKADQKRVLALLSAHPGCGVRTSALGIENSVEAAQRALRAGCWQLQSRALAILAAHGAAPGDLSRVPDFLRPGSRRSP